VLDTVLDDAESSLPCDAVSLDDVVEHLTRELRLGGDGLDPAHLDPRACLLERVTEPPSGTAHVHNLPCRGGNQRGHLGARR
jgi:hypothetical protein